MKINLLIERSRFAAGQYDINLANEAEREVADMQARIEALEYKIKRLDRISRRKLRDGETIYNTLSAIQLEIEKAIQ